MGLAIWSCCGTAAVALAVAGMALGCDSDTETDGTGGSGGGTASSGAIVIAGVFWGSCVPDDGVNNSIADQYDGTDEFAAAADPNCLANKSNGCTAVTECTGVTVDLSGPCTESCSNGVWDVCDDSLHFSVECSQVGMTCSAEINECISEPLGPACDAATFEWICDGTDQIYCSDGYEKRNHCADDGMVCGTDPYGEASCLSAGPPCDDATMQLSCDGSDLVVCLFEHEHRVSCASMQSGWSCHQLGDETFCAAAAECVPGERNASCDGNDIVVCNAGRTERVDCTALGFERCDDSGNRAVCAPTGWLN